MPTILPRRKSASWGFSCFRRFRVIGETQEASQEEARQNRQGEAEQQSKLLRQSASPEAARDLLAVWKFLVSPEGWPLEDVRITVRLKRIAVPA